MPHNSNTIGKDPSISLVSLLEIHVAETRKRKSEIELEIETLKTELEAVKVAESDWQRALARAQQLAGITQTILQESPVAQAKEKFQIFEEFAKKRGTGGFTIRDIEEAYKSRGIDVGKNYAYLMVMKFRPYLKRKGNSHGMTYYWREAASE